MSRFDSEVRSEDVSTVDYYVHAHGEFARGRRRMLIPAATRMDKYLNTSCAISPGHTNPTRDLSDLRIYTYVHSGSVGVMCSVLLKGKVTAKGCRGTEKEVGRQPGYLSSRSPGNIGEGGERKKIKNK